MHTGTSILQIRNRRVGELVAWAAALRQSAKTDAALEHERERLEAGLPLVERLRPSQARFAARPSTALEADEALHDELSGEP